MAYSFQKEVNVNKLERELKIAFDLSTFDYFNTEEGNLLVFFKRELTEQEEILLNDLISSHDPIDSTQSILDSLKYYQIIAPDLLNQLYVENTLLGITDAQSDFMFDEYSDVLLRLKEGAFPTALYRLSQKVPSGFITQELIDSWKNKILNSLL